MPTSNPPSRAPEPPEKEPNFLLQVSRYTQLAFVLPAATVVGWLVGSALDHWLHRTWISIVGLIVGIVSGFVELIRTVLKSTDSE